MPRPSVVVCALLGAACANVFAQDELPPKAKDTQSVYVRDSAVATEKLALAQRMEHLKEWDKSADVYQEITLKYADRVLPSHTDDNGRPTQYISVALNVQELIAKWPAEGLAVYRRRFEDTARDLLNSNPDDRATCQKVLTQYFATDAGRDAGLHLMGDAFERGEFASAAWTGTRLLTLHPGLIAERPRVLFETALADHLGGNDAAAKPWGDELQSRFPNATGTVRGVDVKLADTLVAELKSQPTVVSSYQSDNWPSAFGTPDGSAVPAQISAGGAKLFSIDLPRNGGGRGTNRALRPNPQSSARDRLIGTMTGILPSIEDGTIYFQDNARVYAIDLASGLPLAGWLQTYPGDKHGAFGIDATPTPRGKQMAVAVQGDNVVAILGQTTMTMADPTLGQIQSEAPVVNLDRNSGKRNWSVTMAKLKLPDDLVKLHDAAFYGTPIVTGDSVYALIHANRGGQFEECYIISLKLSDGTFQWSSYVASTSSGAQFFNFDENNQMGTGTTAQVAFSDDRLYVLTNQGAMACLDANDGKTLWLNLYPRANSALRGRPQAFIQNEQAIKPFAINPPIVSDGRVFVMPTDGQSVFVYDANTGDTVAEVPRKLDRRYEPADMLLAAVGDRLVMGNRGTIFVAPWKTFDPLKTLVDNGGMYRSFTASDSNEADAIRGRPFVSAKYVLIPTADKLYRMTLDRFKFESVYPAEGKWDDDESPGNVLATPDNLIIAGPTRVTAYADLTVATAKLDTRIAQNPADVQAYLHYGELYFAAGKPVDAIAKLDQAIQQMGGADKLAGGPERDRLFEILCNAAVKAQKSDTPSPDVVNKLFDRAKFVASNPAQQVRYRLTQAAYFRKTGDVASEINLDQQILADASFRSAPASDQSGSSTAGAVAEQSIRDLIQQHGVQVYASYEAEAFKRLTAAKTATPVDPAALLAIADEFPASQQSTDALALAGDQFEAMHQPRAVTQTLRRLLQRGVTNERKLVVLESLARNYLAVPNQLDTAIVRLKQAKDIAADAKLAQPMQLADGRTLKDITIGQAYITLQQYRDTVAAASLPKLGLVAASDGGPAKAFVAPVELGAATGVVRQPDEITRNDRFVAIAADFHVTAYDTTAGKALWPAVAFGETPIAIPAGCGFSGNSLIVIGPTRAMAIDADGKVRWQVMLSALPAADLAAPIEATDKSDVADDDDQPVVNGNPIQIRRLIMRNARMRQIVAANAVAPRDDADDAAVQGEQISKWHLLSDRLLLGTSTGRVIALDLAQGKPLWQARLQELDIKHFLANEDFVAVSYIDGTQGSDVYALDAITGRVILHNAYGNNQNGLPMSLMNLALSPDGVLVTMQGNRLLGRDLYDLSTPQWSANVAATGIPMDMPFNQSSDDNQLVIAEDRVLAVFRSSNGLQSVRPYDLRTLEAKTFHDDRMNRDVAISYPSRSMPDRDGTGVMIVATGPFVYLFGPHSLAAYNLNQPQDTSWHTEVSAVDHGLTREFVVGQDYAVLVKQPANPNQNAPRLAQIEINLHLRAPTSTGAESGLLDRRPMVRDPAGFSAEQWQVVDGGFAYVSGDGKLKLLRVNR